MALLVVHGLAGVFWIPASLMLMLMHQIVRLDQRLSAIRLDAIRRYRHNSMVLSAGTLFVVIAAMFVTLNMCAMCGRSEP